MKSLLGVVVVAMTWVGMAGSSEAGINFDETYYRGDCNGSGSINISDPTFLGNYLYSGGPQPPCMSACDANADGSVNGSDQIFLYNYLFSGGPRPYGTVQCN